MSKPTPKQNFLQTLLIMATIFLGVQLLFNRNADKPDTRTLDQIHQAMVVDNQKLLDLSIVPVGQEYTKKLDQLLSAKVITKEDYNDKQIEAAILIADTQLKSGLYEDNTGKIRAAYQSLLPFEKSQVDTPAWTKSVPVPTAIIPGPFNPGGVAVTNGVTKFPWTSWSGQDLYAEIVKTLSARNRTEYVYGIIPGYSLMDLLVHLTGANPAYSYAFAAFFLALLVRSLVYPLSQKQLMFSRQMSQLVPLTNEIKAKYKNDTAVQQQKVMELYKEYGINPLAGCFPALIQMPLFLTVYQCMLKYQFAFQNGHFLWINPVTSKATHGWTAPNLGMQDYILIFIYGITMVTASLLTPVSDPSQAKQQRLMGAGVSVLFAGFMFTGALPVVSGFVLYWTFTNLLATAQSLRAYRMPMPPLVKLNASTGGVLPKASRWQQMMEKVMEEQQKNGAKNGGIKPLDAPITKANNNGAAKPTAFQSQEPKSTGTPAKHKPKKRK